MEEPDLQKRVTDLEVEVTALRMALKPDAEAAGVAARSSSLFKVLKENWVLLSFAVALLTAGYVKLKFGINYFDSYRNVATNRELSSFYEHMGDGMMAKSEWVAAEQAYREALKVNPNNDTATFKIAKAEVFQPTPGEKYASPEVIDAKLKYLLEKFPDDYQVYFLEAVRYEQMQELENAQVWLQKCIAQEPNKFARCYIDLGAIEMGQSKVKEAKANFLNAARIDPESGIARNDVAVSQFFLTGDFSEAAKGFEESSRRSPSIVTALNIGRVYWYLGRFADALDIHQRAANYMDKDVTSDDRVIGGAWNQHYYPLHMEDVNPIHNSVTIYTLEEKKASVRFALAIDLALLQRFGEADEQLTAALKLQPASGQRLLAENWMHSVENIVQMSASSKSWLEEHRQLLRE